MEMREDCHDARQEGRPRRPQRTQQACARCRRQKLRCDSYRPCAMCDRSNEVCRPQETASRTRRRRVNRDLVNNPSSQSLEQVKGQHSHPQPSTVHPACAPSVHDVSDSPQSRQSVPGDHDPSPDSRGADQHGVEFSVSATANLMTPASSILGAAFGTAVDGTAIACNATPRNMFRRLSADRFADARQDDGRDLWINTCALRVTRKILEAYQPSKLPPSKTYCLPGGESRPTPAKVRQVSISNLMRALQPGRVEKVVMQLPSKSVCDVLIESYEAKVQWLLWIFNMQDFLQTYKTMMTESSRISAEDPEAISNLESDDGFGFAMLTLVVVTLGAWHARHDQVWLERVQSAMTAAGDPRSVDLFIQTSTEMLKSEYMAIMMLHNVTSIQISLLLGELFVGLGELNTTAAILGSTTRIAHSLSLHREWPVNPPTEGRSCYSSWGADRNTRKFVWWSLRIHECFSAIASGLPSGISPTDCEVSYPCGVAPALDITCNADRIFSVDPTKVALLGQERISEMWANYGLNPEAPPTLFDYQVKKFALYELVHETLSTIYRPQYWCSIQKLPAAASKSLASLVATVKNLSVRLREWELMTPETLKLRNINRSMEVFGLCHRDWSVLQLQALAAQVGYDMATILVHRPLLHYKLGNGSAPAAFDPFKYSADACWSAGSRMSRIYQQYPDLFQKFRHSAMCAALTMHLMTAGVVLACIATSDFRTSRSQEAKLGVGRIIKMLNMLAESTPIGKPGAALLKELLNIVLLEELDDLCDTRAGSPEPGPGVSLNNLSSEIANETSEGRLWVASRSGGPGNHPAGQHSNPSTSPRESWPDWTSFDLDAATADAVPIDISGMDLNLLELERDWMITMQSGGR